MTDTPKTPAAIDHEEWEQWRKAPHPYLDAFNALQAAHRSISQTFKALEVAQNNLSDCHDAYWQMRNNFEEDEKRRLRRSGRGDGPPALITLRRRKTNEQTNED